MKVTKNNSESKLLWSIEERRNQDTDRVQDFKNT